MRVIEGGRTRLSRTSHAIAFDEKNDEIVVPNTYAEAVLFFNGNGFGATGIGVALRSDPADK